MRLPCFEDGRKKGFGYVEFEDVEAAKSAMKWDQTDFYGRPIRMDFAAARRKKGSTFLVAELISFLFFYIFTEPFPVELHSPSQPIVEALAVDAVADVVVVADSVTVAAVEADSVEAVAVAADSAIVEAVAVAADSEIVEAVEVDSVAAVAACSLPALLSPSTKR